jgi:hypothetical protein
MVSALVTGPKVRGIKSSPGDKKSAARLPSEGK